MIYPIVRVIAVLLKQENHEAFRFIDFEHNFRELLGEIGSLLNR